MMHKLLNPLKNYAWGSPGFIPGLLGRDPDPAVPVAEMWMGAHPAGSSRVQTDEGERILRELIASDPEGILGRFALLAEGELPFLLKVLAAAQPLSLQVHPSAAQARLGFERENSLGLPPDSPLRNYRDPRPKPELLCALTEFKALCGFRPYLEIVANLRAARLDTVLQGFAAFARHQNWHSFLKLALELLSLNQDALRQALAALESALRNGGGLDPAIGACCRELQRYYPEDPGLLAPLYLNVFILKPGEALYLEAGVLHAYLEGAGIEIMANSDNVLRGGLSPKHVDLEELARVLDFGPYPGKIIHPIPDGPHSWRYPTPAREFELRKILLDGCSESGLDLDGAPLLALCTEGSVWLDTQDEKLELQKGESAFIGADSEGLRFEGEGELWLATLPAQN